MAKHRTRDRMADRAAIDAAIKHAARSGERFSANTIRHLLPDVNPAAIGTRFGTARRDGVIEHVGHEPSTDQGTHGKEVKVWRGTEGWRAVNGPSVQIRAPRYVRMLRSGKHPVTHTPVHPDAPPVDNRDATGPRCGNCIFRETKGHSRAICTRVEKVRPAVPKVSAWFPACIEHERNPDEEVFGLRIEDVIVGERARKDLGDIEELMQSIKDRGQLLQPILVTHDNELIAGGRRLEACKRLGWTEIPAVTAEDITTAVDKIKAERDENTCRKDMTWSELVAIGRRIEELERPQAEARMAASQAKPGERVGRSTGTTAYTTSDNAPQRTVEVVGQAIGASASTYQRARTMVQAAEAGDESAAEAVAEMDRTGTVTPVWRQWRGQAPTPAGSRKAAPRETADIGGVGAPEEHAPEVSEAIRVKGYRPIKRGQRASLTSAISALNGLSMGFESVNEIDPSITDEEAAQWAHDLSNSLRVLRSLHKKLKEHCHGNP